MKHKAMKLVKKLSLLVMVFSASLSLFADDELDALLKIRASASSPLVLGEIRTGLDQCKKWAEEYGIPLVAIWSNEGCAHCKRLEAAMASEAFLAHAKKSGLIICFTCSRDPDGKVGGTTYNWCWGSGKSLGTYPFVRFYWKKDGKLKVDTAKTGDTVRNNKGADGKTETKTDAYGTYSCIAGKTSNAAGIVVSDYLNAIFAAAGYVPVEQSSYQGGEFGEIGDLYAGKSTNVTVNLVRTDYTDTVATNNIAVAAVTSLGRPAEFTAVPYPSGTVVWKKGQTNAVVNIMILNTEKSKAGDKVVVDLNDGEGEEHDTTAIVFSKVYMGGEFEVAETNAYLRKTESVTLTLTRSDYTEFASSNTVHVAYPAGYPLSAKDIAVGWAAGETAKQVTIPLSTAWNGQGGEKATITLKDEYAATVAGETATITFVKPPYLGASVKEVYTAQTNKVEKGSADLATGGMPVVLEREGDAAEYTYTNIVKVIYTNGGTGAPTNEQYNVVFAPGEATKTIQIPVANLSAGAGIAVQIFGTDTESGLNMSEADYKVVADEANSAGNPYWIGEKTAATIKPGDWTMDFDVAQAAAKTNGGKLFVYVGGTLWCPYCIGAEKTLLGDTKFKSWATENKIYCVTMDMPIYGKDQTVPEGFPETAPSPCLLSDAVYSGTHTRKADSGVDYLTRKIVDAAKATEILTRNFNCATNWCLPNTNGQVRVGFPTFLIMDDAGKVWGRYNSQYSQSGSDYVYNVTENILRLKDLVTLVGEDGEELNQNAQTTPFTYTTGSETNTTLHINDTVDVYKMTDTNTATRLFVATPNVDIPVTLTMTWYNDDGTVKSTQTSTTGRMLLNETDLENAYLSVGAYGDYAKSATPGVSGKALSASVEISSAVVLIPTLESATYTAKAGTEIDIDVVSGKVYRVTFSGGTLTPGAGLTPVEEGSDYYLASVTGVVELGFTADGTLEYCLWDPGVIGFSNTTVAILESTEGGTGTVKVVRKTGAEYGATGEMKIRVKYDDEATKQLSNYAKIGERFDWAADGYEVVWADGESGDKTVSFPLLKNQEFEGRQPFRIYIENSSAAGMAIVFDPAATNATVEIFDTEKPCFGDTAFDITMAKGVGTLDEFKLFNVDGARRVTLKKVSGTLPPGVSLAFDSAENSAVLTGAPTRLGEWKATYSVQITRLVEGKVVTEKTDAEYQTVFNFKVVDPTKSAAEGGVTTPNPYMGTTLNFLPTPVYSTYLGNYAAVGLVAVNASASGKVTAKLTRMDAAAISFAGNWLDFNGETGAATAEMVSREGGVLVLTLGADGTLAIEIAVPGDKDALKARAITTLSPWSKATPADAYAGRYTVTLPTTASDDGAPTGTATLTLAMTSASAKDSGKFTYAGTLPNGSSISGSAVLIPDGEEKSILAVINRSAKNALSAVMAVKAGNEEEGGKAVAPTNITAPEGVASWWLGNEVMGTLNVFGGFYDPAHPIEACCESYYDKSVVFKFTIPEKIASVYGEMEDKFKSCDYIHPEGTNLKVFGRENGFTFTFNKANGVVYGRVPLVFKDGKGKTRTVSAAFKGVVMPGWTDCGCTAEPPPERPFASGAVYFTDRENGATVTRGAAFDLDARVPNLQ